MTPLDIVLASWSVSGLLLTLLASVTCYRREQEHDRHRREWRDERRELLNRIQRPDHLPVAPRPDFLAPEREPDEWNKVGQVVIDPGYGLDETD